MNSTSSPSEFEYHGDLATTPLPEVLTTIDRYKVPGVISCTRGVEVKRIYVDARKIIFVTSNQLRDSLGDRLLARGVITQTQYDESVRRLKLEKKRQGAILVEMKVFEPKDLFVAVREQVQAIVWSIFEWSEGTVTFQLGRDRDNEFIKLNIPIRQAVLQGVRSVSDPRALVARIGTRATLLEHDPLADFSDLTLAQDEQALLSLVDGKRTLSELTTSDGLPPAENAKLLYAFQTLKLIRVKESKQVKVQIKQGSRTLD